MKLSEIISVGVTIRDQIIITRIASVRWWEYNETAYAYQWFQESALYSC